VRIADGRARAAVVALLLTAGVRVFAIGVDAWRIALLDRVREGSVERASLDASEQLADVGLFSSLGVTAIAALLFLSWLSRTMRVADRLSATSVRWTPAEAVKGFFLPVVGIVRPYLVLRDLYDQLEPDAVPEPAPRPRLDGTGGYRDVPLQAAPRPRALPRASIGAWWALFLAGMVATGLGGSEGSGPAQIQASLRVGIEGEALVIAGTLLAVLVVRAVAGRLVERYRRVRYASDEELEAWGIAA
jgi:hypothetical protein